MRRWSEIWSQKGAKLHQTKIACVSQTVIQEERSANTDKTFENQSQDAYYTTEDIRAAELKD